MRAREVIEAMTRRSFLRRLGVGAAAAAAGPGLLTGLGGRTAKATASASFDEMDALDWAMDEFQTQFGGLAARPLAFLEKYARASGADPYDTLESIWDRYGFDAYDTLKQAVDNGVSGAELDELVAQAANEATNKLETEVSMLRSERWDRREKVNRKLEQERREKAKRSRPRKPLQIYTSHRPGDVRRGMDQPRIHDQRPRVGEALTDPEFQEFERRHAERMQPVINALNPFQRVMLELDVALTGNSPAKVASQIHHYPESVEAWIREPGGNPLWYLSDGGYSRVVWITRTGKMNLTYNSTPPVVARWEQAAPQVKAAEDFCNAEYKRLLSESTRARDIVSALLA